MAELEFKTIFKTQTHAENTAWRKWIEGRNKSLRLLKSGRQDDYQTALFQLNRRVKCGLGHGVCQQILRILGLVWRLRPILLPLLFWCFSQSGQPLHLPEAREFNFISISLLFLGVCLLGCACCPMDAPDLAFCSVTLRVFDKLSWTLCVVECQFVKYPKCGSCLASPGPGQSK